VCGKEPLRGFEPARSAAAARAPDRCGDANFANKSPVLRHFALLFASPLFSLSLAHTKSCLRASLDHNEKRFCFVASAWSVRKRRRSSRTRRSSSIAAMNEDLVQVGFGEGMMSDVEVKKSSSKLQDVEMMKQEIVNSEFMDEQPDLAARRFLAEIESEMERVKEIFVRVENANNESKALHRTDSLRTLWHRMNNDIALVSSRQSLAQSTTSPPPPPPPVSLHPSVAWLRREGNYGRFLMIDLYEASIHCHIQRRLETFPSIDGTCLIVTEPRSVWTPTFFLICNCIAVCSACR